jgi:hypothetical protein
MAMKLTLKVASLLALLAVVQFALLFSPLRPPGWKSTFLEEWGAKHARFSEPAQNRLIVTGGSNVAFGIDSSWLESVTKRPTINLGLHAGVGLEFMLNEIVDDARPGDLVILIPEYEQFYGDLMYGELPLVEILQDNPSGLRYVSSWWQWVNVFKNAQVANRNAVFNRLDQLKTRLRRGANPDRNPIYERDAFDARGDAVAHLELPHDPDLFAAAFKPIRGALNERAFASIARCAVQLEMKGAKLVIVYPSVAASYWARHRDAAQGVAARMPTRWTLTRPEDWVFEDRLFYDTHYHLGREGRQIRTEQLAKALRAAGVIASETFMFGVSSLSGRQGKRAEQES